MKKKLQSFLEDQLIISKQQINAKIVLNHFQFPEFKSTKRQPSSVDKRRSPAFIKNTGPAVTYRCEQANLLFSSEIYYYCQSLSDDGSDLYHGVKSNISIDSNKWQVELKFHHQLFYWLNLVQCLEVTLILVLLKRRLFNNIKKLSSGYLLVNISFVTSNSAIV